MLKYQLYYYYYCYVFIYFPFLTGGQTRPS